MENNICFSSLWVAVKSELMTYKMPLNRGGGLMTIWGSGLRVRTQRRRLTSRQLAFDLTLPRHLASWLFFEAHHPALFSPVLLHHLRPLAKHFPHPSISASAAPSGRRVCSCLEETYQSKSNSFTDQHLLKLYSVP